MISTAVAIVTICGIALACRGALCRWVQKRKDKREARKNERAEREWKKKFLDNMHDIDDNWSEPKKQNIIYKGAPEFASAWE